MTTGDTSQITDLLVAWSDGDAGALEQLIPLVDHELQQLAHHYMAGESAGHPLQTTALVNEAFVRLIDGGRVRWQSRAHFFAVSARLMRRILVDVARARKKLKRGGDAVWISLDDAPEIPRSNGRRADCPRRRLDRACGVRRAQEPGRGTALLRRPHHRRNRGRAARVAHHGHARLGSRQGMACTRDASHQ